MQLVSLYGIDWEFDKNKLLLLWELLGRENTKKILRKVNFMVEQKVARILDSSFSEEVPQGLFQLRGVEEYFNAGPLHTATTSTLTWQRGVLFQ